MTAACTSCGHARTAHTPNCAGRTQRVAIDGYPWSRPCHCTSWHPTLLERIRGWLS